MSEPAPWVRVVEGLGVPADALAEMRAVLAAPRVHDHHGPEPCRTCGGLAPSVRFEQERARRLAEADDPF